MKKVKPDRINIAKQVIFIFSFIAIYSLLTSHIFAKEQFVYIASANNKIVTIIDLENYSKTNLTMGFNPYYLKKIPGYDQLWIYRKGSYDGYLNVVNPVTGESIYESNLKNILCLAPSSNGIQVFVAYETNPVQIKVISTHDFSELRSFTLVGLNNLYNFELSQDNQIIYTLYSNTFYIINANDGNVINAISLNESFSGLILSPNETYAYLYGNYWYLAKINLSTLETKTISVSRDIDALAISHDSRLLYAAMEYESKVTVYNAETLALVSSFPVGSQDTEELKVSSDNKLLYVLNQNNPNFEIYECQTGKRKAAFYTGSNTYDFDFDYPPSDSIRPQPVSDVQLLTIYDDGALVSWTAASDDSASEPVRGYEVRYDTVSISDISQAKLFSWNYRPSFPGTTDSLRIDGLDETTNYWLAIRTVDEAKNYSDSVIVEFTTLSSPQITVVPDSFDISVAIGDTIKRSFTISNSGGADAGALDYQIQMSSVKNNIAQFAYIANYNERSISMVDLTHFTEKRISTSYRPRLVKKSPLTNDLWVIDTETDVLFILDPAANKMKTSFSLSGLSDIQFSPDGTRAFILFGGYYPWIRVLNVLDMSEVISFQLSTNSSINCFAISNDGKYLYTMVDYYFYKFNAVTGKTISSSRLENYRPRFIQISPDDKFAYLCGDNYLTKLDLQNFTVKSTNIGSTVSAAALSLDGEQLLLGFNYGISVSVYNTASLTQTQSIFVENEQVTDIKISPDLKYLYVLHLKSPNLGIYDLATGNQLRTFSTGNSTYHFDISGSSLPYLQIDPIIGTLKGGESEKVTLTINTQSLTHNIYTADLLVQSNDPEKPNIIFPIRINAQDTRGPDFNMAFFINPLLPNYLKVLVFAREFLTDAPVLTANNSTVLSLAVHDSSYFIYLAKYKLTTSDNIDFSVTGSDSIGNSSTFQRQLQVANVPLGKEAALSSANGDLTVKFQPGSFDQERFIILWDEQDEDSEGMIYHIGPEFMQLQNAATLEINYSNLNKPGTTYTQLAFYRKTENGEWEQLPGRIDEARKILKTDITQLGVYKVGFAESKPNDEIAAIPGSFELLQNRPNPFNPITRINYKIPKSGHARLIIYNMLGQVVAVLVDGIQAQGTYSVTWDAKHRTSGIYLCRFEADGFTATKKMFLQK